MRKVGDMQTRGTPQRFAGDRTLLGPKADMSGKANTGVRAKNPNVLAVNDKNELWISGYGGLARCDHSQ